METDVICRQDRLLRVVHIRRWLNSWLRQRQTAEAPSELGSSKVNLPLLLNAVRDADEDTVWCKHAVDFRKHLVCVGIGTLTTKKRIKSALVNNAVKASVDKLQLTHIHALVGNAHVLLSIVLNHLLGDHIRDVDISDA